MTQETFERAKMLYETANADQKYVLKSLFPELAESEDEKIRKALISILKSDFEKDTTIFGISVEQIIAWLEKQGEKPIINGKEFTASENFGYFEEKSADTCDYSIINGKEFPAGEKRDFGYFEEKSADTVEPKFKVGDWITNGDYTWKIVEVKPLDYILQSQDGNIVDDTISHVDEQFHSFTIKDARDGDVLALSYASQNYILIYKGLHEKNFGTMMSVFCSYYVEENRYNDETDSFHAMNCGEIITPATKEQRDILIKAMNNARYTFDFEKKEMKYTPKHKVGDTIYYNSFGELKSMIVAYVTTDSTDNPMYEDENGNAVFEKALVEQKPAWSEEDEKIRKELIDYLITDEDIGVSKVGQIPIDNVIDWLEKQGEQKQDVNILINPSEYINDMGGNGCYLKNTTQTSAWSEEDETGWTNTMIMIKEVASNHYTKDSINLVVNFLKSLKDRVQSKSQWKPSEEQMKALKDACGEHWEPDGLDPLYTLYQDLMREKNYE